MAQKEHAERTTKIVQEQKPIIARHTTTVVDAPSRRERPEAKGTVVRLVRQAITSTFGMWVEASTRTANKMGWTARVEPYVGYGTTEYVRIICRTVLDAPEKRSFRAVRRGIANAFLIPAAGTRVRISIDGIELRTVQMGDAEVFDRVGDNLESSARYAQSDEQGYLDLIAVRKLSAGIHDVSYHVDGRESVHSPLFIVPDDAPIGVISDVDDTIMVTEVPTILKAAYNMLLLNPNSRSSVPGMSVLYSKISEIYPQAPFFYLSTSPWNVEDSIRNFISRHGFPEGPLLLRDLDPRPKTFVPSGVKHKLEFVQQLMADFPHMKFILIGDDGQKDPSTYARLTREYPGRVVAIGIRQLVGNETTIAQHLNLNDPAAPAVDVPVFYGPTGANLMKTMLPDLKNVAKK